MMGFMLSAILFNSVIMSCSMKGSITDPLNRRKYISHFLLARCVLQIVEALLYLMGIIWKHNLDTANCSHLILNTYDILVCVYLAFFLLHIFVIICNISNIISSCGSRPEKGIYIRENCKIKFVFFLCGCRYEEDKVAFFEVAKFLIEFFKGFDFALSDILCGLILLNTAQHHPLRRRKVKRNPDAIPLPWMNIHLALHYMDFALSCYGWNYFVYDDDKCTTPCKIFIKKRCCSCVRYNNPNIYNDGYCNNNIAAILSQTKLNIDQIIYADFNNKAFETPFYVAIDHKEKSIVVAIRGSATNHDRLTDLVCKPQNIVIDNISISDAYVHKGISQAAKYVKTVLEKNDILVEAFADMPDYKLVITGHSLGAGTAALLAIMLRPSFPDLICFAFAPPGWLVSSSLLKHTKDFVLSVVLGDDIIARMGIKTMSDLLFQLHKKIETCSLPKYKILMSSLVKKLFYFNLWSLLDSDDEEVSNDGDQSGRKFEMSLNEVLYMPGRVMHIIYNKHGSNKEPKYYQVWDRAENFDEIHVSIAMLTDHYPSNLKKALLVACNSTQTY